MTINKENMRNIWIVGIIAAYTLWVTTSDKIYAIFNISEEKNEVITKVHVDNIKRKIVLVKTTEYRKRKESENWLYAPHKQLFDTLDLQRIDALELKNWSQIWLEKYRHFACWCDEIKKITDIDTLTIWELENLGIVLDGNLKDVKRQDIY